MPKKVVVVLPTFNEKDNIEGFIQSVLGQEKNLPGYKLEVLVVDSHSPDGTGKIAQQVAKKNPKVHVLEVERGLGVALIKGHKYSVENLSPDILAQLDADGQVEVDVLPKLVAAIDEGFDLAIGSRFVKGGENKLSITRKIFSAGSSFVCRFVMGPWKIKEFTNSARAFTPQLFKKINLQRLPWREKTFIIQPAFLNEAILAGATYKEVPLVFKNRAEGYSKNKVLSYISDVVTYSIDARLHKLGLNIPFFKMVKKGKTFFKFAVVGVVGTVVDFIFYKIFISRFGLIPPIAKIFSTSIAVQNNFVLNNSWTFKDRKTTSSAFIRWLIFNAVSSGGVVISFLVIFLLHRTFGDGFITTGKIHLAYNTVYFFLTIPPVMAWNFTVNHFITWRHKDETIAVNTA